MLDVLTGRRILARSEGNVIGGRGLEHDDPRPTRPVVAVHMRYAK
jgi:hypothetical protein